MPKACWWYPSKSWYCDMKKIIQPPKQEWEALLARPVQSYDALEETVALIFREISESGDAAVKAYTRKFDGADLETLEVAKSDVDLAADRLSEPLKEAINLAYANIEAFHRSQQIETRKIDTAPGVTCWQEKRPIQKVGLYIPGGTAPLFSTILMLAIPARIAGCEEVVLCTPSDQNGQVHPAILYTASLCGVQKIYRIGGIQAIAAMTFGTESITRVYKIFGPGNQYVTAAKQMAQRYGVAIDLPAGPSELLVLADDTAIPAFVASDLLSQAEHGADSQVVLVTTSRELLEQVESEIEVQILELPRRELASLSMANSRLICMPDLQEALALVNAYAPEHLIICCRDSGAILPDIVNAGSVFLGNYTPESAGDYASGTNHTLPTNGYARNFSGVNLDSFCKSLTFQQITEEGLQHIGTAIELMAEAEGLQAHRNAVTLRLKQINQKKNQE